MILTLTRAEIKAYEEFKFMKGTDNTFNELMRIGGNNIGFQNYEELNRFSLEELAMIYFGNYVTNFTPKEQIQVRLDDLISYMDKLPNDSLVYNKAIIEFEAIKWTAKTLGVDI